MQKEILFEYEKIKDQLSEEEFLAEMEEVRKSLGDVDFMNDIDFARMVLKNHGISEEIATKNDDDEATSLEEFEDNISEDEATEVDEEPVTVITEMSDEVLKIYKLVQDQISEEDFLAKMNEYNSNYSGIGFMDDVSLANMVKGEFITVKNPNISDREEFAINSINQLEDGNKGIDISGRVMSISNPKTFTTRKGNEGQVCNVELADDTASIKVVFWTPNIKLLKNFTEGDIIKITEVDIKTGYRDQLEANMRPRSTIVHLKEADESKFPAYQQVITNIADIKPDEQVNIIARIIRIPTTRTYEKDGKEGQVTSLELQDGTGKISYTLWNKNVDLIRSLDLNDGDTVKILAARSRAGRDNEITLTHWDGRIIKGDYDVPEIEQEFIKIADLQEQKDVSIIGVVSKLQDIRTFTRRTDNSEGKLRNFDVMDDTESIRVTVWGNDTNIPINKGDIVKIIGGDVRYDDYTATGYSMNTNFNTQITLNPTNLSVEELDLFNQLREQLKPVRIGDIQEISEDGLEIDVIGRILSIGDIREFQRDDGSVGIVRSITFADESGKVQLSLWDEKANVDYEVGGAYQVENARSRLGMYSVDLNIGNTCRVIKLSDEQASAMFIPELETLEKMIYTNKKIDDIEDEDEENLILIGRIIEIYDTREFDRDNGDKGFVRNIEIADDTGSMRVTLWNDDAKKEFELGEAIKFQNPRIVYKDDHLEINVSGSTAILKPSENELSNIPSYDELKEIIYAPKTIESLTDDDVNVRITGTLKDLASERILLKKCPNCGNSVEQTDMDNICDFCSEEFDKPRYLLMIPARLEDDTGDISITFFDNLAEELLGMKKEEIIQLTEDGYGIEDKVEDLEGLTVEVIANVGFNDYNEENRLTPKKILSKYY